MKIHVLPGDAQVEEFRKTGIDGEIVVCREALIDGDVRADDLEEFWTVREQFRAAGHPESHGDYRKSVVSEFEKLLDLKQGNEVNLWFEYELFCHVNMWFCTWLLRETRADVYRVEPIVQTPNTIWNGFGDVAAEQMSECYARRVKFTEPDLKLGADLWTAFRNRDYKTLRELSVVESPCFPYLKEACEAEIEKETRPKQILRELKQEGVEDFGEMFAAFKAKAGVYGYGDSQVERLLSEI